MPLYGFAVPVPPIQTFWMSCWPFCAPLPNNQVAGAFLNGKLNNVPLTEGVCVTAYKDRKLRRASRCWLPATFGKLGDADKSLAIWMLQPPLAVIVGGVIPPLRGSS